MQPDSLVPIRANSPSRALHHQQQIDHASVAPSVWLFDLGYASLTAFEASRQMCIRDSFCSQQDWRCIIDIASSAAEAVQRSERENPLRQMHGVHAALSLIHIYKSLNRVVLPAPLSPTSP